MEMRARLQRPGENVAVYIYDKLHVLAGCNFTWASPVARRHVIDGSPTLSPCCSFGGAATDLSPKIFVRLPVQLQQGTTRRAEEPYVQAAAQPLTEIADTKPGSSEMSPKVEEVTSDTGPAVIEDGVHRPISQYQAGNQSTVFSAKMPASLEDNPPSTLEGLETSPPTEGHSPPSLNIRPLEGQQEPTKATDLKDHENSDVQPDDVDVRRHTSRDVPFLSAPQGLPQYWADELMLPLTTPTKQRGNGPYNFAH